MTEQTPDREALRDHCPTCGVSGRDECHTSNGRDHPARRHYARGFDAAMAVVEPLLAERDALARQVEERDDRAVETYRLLQRDVDRMQGVDRLCRSCGPVPAGAPMSAPPRPPCPRQETP